MLDHTYFVIGARPGSAALSIGQYLTNLRECAVMHTTCSRLIKRRVIGRPDEYYKNPDDLIYIKDVTQAEMLINLDVTSDESIAAALETLRTFCVKWDAPLCGIAYLAAGGGLAESKVIGAARPDLTEEEWESARRVNYQGLHRILTLDAAHPSGPLFREGSQCLALGFLAGMPDVPLYEYGHMRQLKQELIEAMAQYAAEFPDFGFTLLSVGPFSSMSAKAIPRFTDFMDWYQEKFDWEASSSLDSIGSFAGEYLQDDAFRGFRLEYHDGGFHAAYHRSKESLIAEMAARQ